MRPAGSLMQLDDYAHTIAPSWDGFAPDPAETDGGKVLGMADLIPDEAHGRRGI